MPKIDSIPLSPTVSRIFDAFVKKLEHDEIVDAANIAKLREALRDQKFDPNSLFEALFSTEASSI